MDYAPYQVAVVVVLCAMYVYVLPSDYHFSSNCSIHQVLLWIVSLGIMLDFFLQPFYDRYILMFNFISFYPVDQVVVMLCFRLVLHDLVDQVVVMLCFKLLLHDVVDLVVMMCSSVVENQLNDYYTGSGTSIKVF